MEEILDGKDLNITQLNHLIYAAATVITEEINGTGEYKLETQRLKTPPCVRRIEESINGIREELSALVEIKRDKRKLQDLKRTRLLKKYNIEKKHNLDQVNEELKHKVSTKTQRLSRHRKDKTSVTKISCLGQTARNVKTVSGRHIQARGVHQTKRKWRTFGGKYMGKKFNIMERRTGLKTSTNKIQAWIGAQYVKKTSQMH